MKILNNTRQLGVLNGVLYSVNRLYQKITGNSLIYKYYFYVQPVSNKPLLPARLGQGYTIKQLSIGDPNFGYFNRPISAINSRFEQGAICFCAIKNDTPIGFIWIKLGEYTEDEVRCTFNPVPSGKNAWDFDVFISPEDRLGISFALLWDHVNRWLVERDYKWTSSRVSAFNSISIRSHSRLGAKRVGSATFFKFLNAEIGLFSKKPYLFVSLTPMKSPKIKINPPINFDV